MAALGQHRDPARLFTRYVAEDQKEIGGYGLTMRTDPSANRFRFAIFLLPEWETAVLIHQFYTFIMGKCRAFSPAALICPTREDETEKITWLQQQGFEQALRYPRSVLTLADFDPTVYNKLKAKIATQGLEIISLAELAAREPDWQRKVYELDKLLNQDVPRPTAYVPIPFGQYAQTEFADPDFWPEGWLVVMDGDALVGMTCLFKSGDSLEMLENGLTGVHRDYRRRGLATVLKCLAIETVQRPGAKQIQTYNEENNPMYGLNLKLGFQPQPADVDWEKGLT